MCTKPTHLWMVCLVCKSAFFIACRKMFTKNHLSHFSSQPFLQILRKISRDAFLPVFLKDAKKPSRPRRLRVIAVIAGAFGFKAGAAGNIHWKLMIPVGPTPPKPPEMVTVIFYKLGNLTGFLGLLADREYLVKMLYFSLFPEISGDPLANPQGSFNNAWRDL